MEALRKPRFTKRYQDVSTEKSGGATYTPKILADFVAREILDIFEEFPDTRPLRILDPAIGHGELLASILALKPDLSKRVEVYGFETDSDALEVAQQRLNSDYPRIKTFLKLGNFLDFSLSCGKNNSDELEPNSMPHYYDIIIANPPYVRTQILGASQAQDIAKKFGLKGRVDLYHAFILGMSNVLCPNGVAGIIVSNRFMTTRSGAGVRKAISERFNLRHAWDLGDTKIFGAAVLPAVLILEGVHRPKIEKSSFSTIYQTSSDITGMSSDPINALANEGIIKVDDGRVFHVQHGFLNTGEKSDGVWRIATDEVEAWLKKVSDNTWGKFGDIGKIRVGVKTCADKVFIRDDWHKMPKAERPELLKPLITHHVARRFKQMVSDNPKEILYTHEVREGRRYAVDIKKYPISNSYLENNRDTLEGRKYVIEAGREWYEIWVPQNPQSWPHIKLVFRDISEKPVFWVDTEGSVVNGDCYWLTPKNQKDEDLIWLACAIANSTFIEKFYDLRFNNKLYAGRRRFITQYVEKFPLLNPRGSIAIDIIDKSKRIHSNISSPQSQNWQQEVDKMIWQAFTGSEEH